MSINKNIFLKYILIINLLTLVYLPSFKLNIFIEFVSILILIAISKKIHLFIFKFLTPLFLIFIIGFFGLLFNTFNSYSAIKDIFHSLKPILGILLGYLICINAISLKEIIKNIIIASFLSSIIHLLLVFFFTDFASGSISAIRELTRDNFLDMIGLFFILFSKKYFKENVISNKYKKLFIIIILLSCILYFSRTMMIASVFLWLTLSGYTRITAKTIKIISFFAILIIILYSYLFTAKIERGKPGLEAFLYKIKIAPEEIFKSKINRNDHKDLWDHWRAYEAKQAIGLLIENKSNIIFGCGYGSLVNLKFKAPLDGPNGNGLKFISELHNGFVYVLYKYGIAGLLIYLFFLIKLYLFNKNSNFYNLLLSYTGIFYLFTSFTITGLYNTRDVVILFVGVFYGVYLQNKKLIHDKENL